jgi:hypothetical protein
MADISAPLTQESWKTRLTRWAFNLSLVYRSTGGRITHISADWRHVRVRLPLTLWTCNYVGTIFGGSMYSCADPWYMVMLIRNLGKDYTVWDKAATIRFKKPGKSTLYARFDLDQAELDAIREAAAQARSIDRTYTVLLTDAQGAVYAEIDKVIYIRRHQSKTDAAESNLSGAVTAAH